MCKKFLDLLILFFCFLPLLILPKSASAQSLEWFRTYDDTGHIGYSVQQTSDSGYIVAAGSLLIKTDPVGDIIWTRHYVVPNYLRSKLYCVQQTFDSGYIAVGKGWTPFEPSDVILIKTDSTGSPLWIGHYGGDSSDVGWSVQQTTDSGFVIAGRTNSFGAGKEDVYLIKTDSAGDTLDSGWTRTYGGSDSDVGLSVWQTTDGGYIVAGWTRSFGASDLDIYLVKTDPTGHRLRDTAYGGSGDDRAYSVQQTFDGKYIVGGETYSSEAAPRKYLPQAYLMKIDTAFAVSWDSTYGWSGFEGGKCVQQTSDSGYIVCGYSNVLDPIEMDLYLIKTDSTGHTIWSRIFGGEYEEYGYSVQQTLDSGYIVSGYSTSYDGKDIDVYLIKVAPYQRGDANRDGIIDLGDVVYLINYLYRDGPPPNPLAAGDANWNQCVNIGDVLYLINYLYRQGPAPL